MHYVNARWLGGMLTNFRTIRKRIDRMAQLQNMKDNGTFELLPKKEVAKLELEMEKLDKYLGGGVTQMKGFPKQRLEEKIKRMSRKPYPAEDLPIVYTIPGKYDGVIGAALCALEQI